MPDLESLLDQVDEMREEIITLEQDLVRIPTVNTGFMPPATRPKPADTSKKGWPRMVSSLRLLSLPRTGAT